MKFRQLGNSDLRISDVGLGCWQLGGDFGPIESATVQQIIAIAAAQDINFFDTADVYGDGASESYLGEHLAQQNPKPVIATKYGRAGDVYPASYSLNNLRDSVLRAQDRLQTDAIDLLQLHCIPAQVLINGEIFDWLRIVQQEGHIRYFGASVETVDEGLICTEQEGLTSLQVIFNIFRQKLLDELLPKAQEKQIGVIARLPLASGLLSGKFTMETRFAQSDHRNYNRDGQAFSVGETFAGIPFSKGVELVQMLEQKIPAQFTMTQMAMRWILDHPAVTTIIPGASSAAQVIENAKVSDMPSLPDALHRELRDFYQNEVAANIRGAY